MKRGKKTIFRQKEKEATPKQNNFILLLCLFTRWVMLQIIGWLGQLIELQLFWFGVVSFSFCRKNWFFTYFPPRILFNIVSSGESSFYFVLLLTCFNLFPVYRSRCTQTLDLTIYSRVLHQLCSCLRPIWTWWQHLSFMFKLQPCRDDGGPSLPPHPPR